MTETQRHNFRLMRRRLRGCARAERLRVYWLCRAGPFWMMPLAFSSGQPVGMIC